MLIKNFIFRQLQRRTWRKCNRNNDTYLVNAYDCSLIQVGDYTYGPIDVEIAGRDAYLKIGSFCSIAERVKFILSAEHSLENISTFPFRARLMLHQLEGKTKGDIVVGDDVWIGYGSIILSGVTIGQGAVVAAGAVVASDIPPYAVAGGVPAGVLKYRFGEELIQELLKIDYKKLTAAMIQEHQDSLYQSLKKIGQLDWLPRREEDKNERNQ